MNATPAIFILPLIALFLLGGLAIVVALLLNRRTRVFGLVLLAVGVCAPILLLGFRIERGRAYQEAVIQQAELNRAQIKIQPSLPSPSKPAPVGKDSLAGAKAAPSAEQAPPAGVDPKQQRGKGSVIGALGHALASAVPHKDKKAPATVAAKTTSPKTTTAKTAVKPDEPKPAVATPKKVDPAVAKRPEWVGAAPKFTDDAYIMSVTVGPYTTRLECEAKLPEALQPAVAEYVEIYLGPEAARAVRPSSEELRRQLVKEKAEETVQTSMGPMVQLHARLAFDTKIQEWLRDEWRGGIIAGRLRRVAAALAIVLGLLALLFTYLKLTQTTASISR